jgi:hypothetical protein
LKSRFATLLLLTWFSAAVWAAGDWVERKNQEPDPARPLGWRFEVPGQWRQASLARFPYPLGEAWSGGDGGFQVCWLGNSTTLGQEQLNLESRGYTRNERRVAGREALVMVRNQDLFCYIKTPKGSCRLHVTGPTPVHDHILQSFTLIETAEVAAGSEQRFADWGFELPPGWLFQAPDTLTFEGAPVCKLTSHTLEREQMVRGWARSQASSENPQLKERVEMEPFTSKKGVDGYLVEWKGPKGPLLFAYVALKQKGLRVELMKPGELDRLRRLLSSLQFRG